MTVRTFLQLKLKIFNLCCNTRVKSVRIINEEYFDDYKNNRVKTIINQKKKYTNIYLFSRLVINVIDSKLYLNFSF